MGTFHGNIVKSNQIKLTVNKLILLFQYHLQSEITSILDCQCMAIDLRGHGDSHVTNESDLSASILAK